MSRRLFFKVILLLNVLVYSGFTAIQQAEVFEATITSPLPGEAVQGLVNISGSFNNAEFSSYLLEFTFSNQSAGNWFPIANGTELPDDDIIAEWDTSTITDATYTLRLTVTLAESDPFILLVDGIRVRNYSTIETNTPAPTPEFLAATPTQSISQPITPTVPLPGTPTPIDPNRASFSTTDLQESLIMGGLIGLVGFLILALYFFSRRKE